MTYYNFCFYKFYKFMLKIGKNDIPEWKALIYFSGWILFYLIAIIYIPKNLNIMDIKIHKIFFVILFLSVLFVNYILFLKNEKFLKIKKEFETTSKFNTTKGTVLISLFLLLPFVQLFYVLFVMVFLR